MAFPYMEATVGFMILIYIFETYLCLRQYAALKLPTLPRPLEGIISREEFEMSRAYNLDKSYLHFVRLAVNIIKDTVILYFGVIPWFWKIWGAFFVYIGLENQILHTLAFLAGYMIGLQVTDLPFSLYSTFVIQARHGIDKKTISLFLEDIFLEICFYIAIGPPIVVAIIVLVQKGGPYLVIYLWGFMYSFYILVISLYPFAIDPFFNKFTTLPHRRLKRNIENLASSLKFPLRRILLVDSSTTSSHYNVFMYGIFKTKQIFIYETFIQQCEIDEVVAVIANELGHWNHRHTMYKFIAMQVLNFLLLGGYYTLARNSKDLFRSFGFDTQPVVIGIILFQYTLIPLQKLVDFILNLVCRSFEFQADAFAKKLGYSKPLQAVLVKLRNTDDSFQEKNLVEMNMDP
ncbi:CAAX prenyl protease 1 homolog isoform X2 [Macadamia integrifolia]|nr:CAAX prenyl protease 1 homolog isoform X2 [Macadamia integrifolia]